MVKHVNLAVNQNKAQLLTHLDQSNRRQSKALSARPVKATVAQVDAERVGCDLGSINTWTLILTSTSFLGQRGKSMRKGLWLLTSVWIGEATTNQRLSLCDTMPIDLLIWHLATWINMHMTLHILTLLWHEDTVNKKKMGNNYQIYHQFFYFKMHLIVA